MSLVERALKKLQQSGTPSTPDRSVAPVPMQAAAPASTPPTLAEPATFETAPMVVERPTRVVKIDREALRGMQLLPPVAMERRIASQYQQIKRALIASAFGRGEEAVENGQIIMIASALPGEGKTFTSINLALSMAREKDMQVILVSADVAKPHLDAIFGLQGERGLLDLLSDDHLHPDSAILSTDVPRLSILPAGKQRDTATELLASARMQQVMQQMKTRPGRPIVLLDSPPLLPSTESQAMVPSAGQLVLVVRAGVTPRSAVESAIEAASTAKNISLILNQSSEILSDTYYAYGAYGDAAEGVSNNNAAAR